MKVHGIIAKIVTILDFIRYGKVLERRRNRSWRTRLENDTINISDEARRLSAFETEAGPVADGEGIE